MTTALLALLAVLMSGPALWLLGRWTVIRRTPRAAMVLWQAVALAAVLAALAAGLSLVTASGLGRRGAPSYVVAAVALLVTLVVLGRLLVSGHRVGRRLRLLRRRHRDLVDLLGERYEGLRVLPGETPTAYCVPGLLGARVVLSVAAYRHLDDRQRGAVLAHERAHLRARHDLVLEAFTVLHKAFPRVVTSGRALTEVRLLVEVLADRAARARYGAVAMLHALEGLVGATAPEAALGAGGQLEARIAVLLDERQRPLQAVGLYVAAGAVLLLPTLLVVLPWLGSLA